MRYLKSYLNGVFAYSGTPLGGISETTIPNVLSQCAAPLDKGYRSLDGLAVVSAIAASLEPQEAAKRLLSLFRAGSSRAFPLDTAALSPDSKAAKALEVIELACALLVKLRQGPNPLIHHITVRPLAFEPFKSLTARGVCRTRSS